MKGLPSSGTRDHAEERNRSPRLITLYDEITDGVFNALSSSTARKLLAHLYESPSTASELAEITDTSVQNINHHLKKLRSVDLVEVVDIVYSERGTEMKVYAPRDNPVVIVAGTQDKKNSLKERLKKLIPVTVLLAGFSLIIQYLSSGSLFVQTGGDSSIEESIGLPAGLSVFLGGVFVLTVVMIWWEDRE